MAANVRTKIAVLNFEWKN